MAIMRCPDHKPRRTTRDYAGNVEPVGFPETALVCGSKYCREPALIWLEANEMSAYATGERIFQAFTASMKVKAR